MNSDFTIPKPVSYSRFCQEQIYGSQGKANLCLSTTKIAINWKFTRTPDVLKVPESVVVEPQGQQLAQWGGIKRNALLQNFPNPFNPETWIPFRLADESDVTIRIYNSTGQLVRRLSPGVIPAGDYASQSKAIYWDGRNQIGEPVSSGVYLYTINAGDFTTTRKMLIRK